MKYSLYSLIALLFVGLAILALSIVSLFTSSGETETRHEGKGFSVRWMGFMPSYENKYPDYVVVINNLRDPLIMKIALRIKNQENTGYYFTIGPYESPPSGWILEENDLGYIGVDETLSFTYTARRENPQSISEGKLTENLNLVVKAFYDVGEHNLYSQDNFIVAFHLIDYLSPEWDLLYHFDFSGGTLEGWSGFGLSVSDEFYRSFPYSLKTYTDGHPGNGYFSRVFTVGSYEEAYLIFSLRSSNYAEGQPSISLDGELYFETDEKPPNNTWHQYAIPLPTSKTTEANITSTKGYYSAAYLDDVYVIAK